MAELEGEPALDEFIRENDNLGRGLAVASRNIYEHHSLEEITKLLVEELETLGLVSER